MSTPITMDLVMKIVAVIVAIEGLLKAIEWGIGKITAQHDKKQQIDENSISLSEYRVKTDAEIAEVKESIAKAHKYAFDSLNDIKNSITDILNEHREEYLKGIGEVKDSVTDMQAVYQQNTAVIELRIQTLSDRVEKHNNVVERTYKLESDVELMKEKQSVANHRISDLEEKRA